MDIGKELHDDSGWVPSTIGDFISFSGGSQPPRSTFIFTPKDGYVRLLQIRDYKTDKFATYIPVNLAKKTCSTDDIMIGRYGPPIFQILRGLEGAYNVALIKATPKPGLDKEYAYHFLKQKRLFEFIEKLSQRSSGQTGVDLQELRRYPLPLPPTKAEQTAIATTLSDTDALITSLEKLIAKKRNIKQGTMQELLKPKRDWKMLRLGEIGRCIRGVSYNPELDLKKSENQRTLRLLRSNNIQNGTLDLTDVHFVDKRRASSDQMLREGDIIICMANGSKALVGKSSFFKHKESCNYTFGSFMGCFRSVPQLANADFIGYNFQTHSYRRHIDLLLSGSSINNLKPSDIESITIRLPNLDEQMQIAGKLNDFDREINLLIYKLDKLVQLKGGMMQSLLTGKIRLV